MRLAFRLFLLLLFALQVMPLRAAGPTVEAIRKAGALTCGLDQSEAEYSMNDEHGSRVAFDTDLCKAVAAALLGTNGRVIVKGYPDADSVLDALRSKEVDLVSSVSHDLSNAASVAIAFTRPVLYDGQGFLVPRSVAATNATALSGKKICFLAETEAELNLRSWFERRHLNFVPFPFQEEGEMEAAFATGNCAALSADLTRLGNIHAALGASARDYLILPEVISKDTLASAYRRDDPELGNIADWAINALLEAEELGLTSQSFSAARKSAEPAIQRLTGVTGEVGRPLGLDPAWAVRAVQQAGNFGELFRRDLGESSALGIPRGQNALWTEGGLMQSLPFK